MNRKLFYLKKLDLFKALPDKEMEYISKKFGEREYKKRQIVFEPKDVNKVFLLKSGRVEIYELTSNGKKKIVDTLVPGNVFGDLGVNKTNEYFVEATADSYVCIMKKDEFIDMMGGNPEVSRALIKELFSKIVESEKHVASLLSDNLMSKIKSLLIRLAKKHGEEKEGRTIITTKFTHEKLAEMIGISRPTMTEALNKLEKGGIIKRDGKIISFDPQELEDL